MKSNVTAFIPKGVPIEIEQQYVNQLGAISCS